MINEVKRFRSSDGGLFETEERAKAHEASLDLKKWYLCESNRLSSYNSYPSEGVDFDCLKDWLEEHRLVIQSFYSNMATKDEV